MSDPKPSHKVYLIAGEASGDLHGANLIRSLKQRNSNILFRCWGGEKMEEAGAELVSHYSERAVMGIWEVLRNIRRFKKWIKECKDDILAYQPDVLVLIDYGGFNLRIAEFAHQQGIEVHYYIPPKVWAWNEKRVHKIRKYTNKAYVILPFEEPYYRKHGVDCTYVGNPLLEEIQAYRHNTQTDKQKEDYIALLPGSRKQEIRYILPSLLKYAQQKTDLNFQLAMASSQRDLIRSYPIPGNVQLIEDQTYSVINHATAAVVTSGTANLETALLNTPQVVVYRTGFFTYVLGKIFIKVKYLSPVNLIAEKEVVKELLQYNCSARIIQREVDKIVHGPHRELVIAANKKIIQKMGEPGASERVAKSIYEALSR